MNAIRRMFVLISYQNVTRTKNFALVENIMSMIREIQLRDMILQTGFWNPLLTRIYADAKINDDKRMTVPVVRYCH